VENVDIARTLEQVADFLEIQGANPFRVRAYRNAARVIEGYGEPLRRLVDQGDELTEIQGVGKDMAGHIEELVQRGQLGLLEQLREQVPAGLLDVTRLQGVGPKKAAKLWKELGITSLADLQKAAEQGRVAELKGFGQKTEQSILEHIQSYQAQERRFLLSEADTYVEALVEHMEQAPGVQKLEVAGSWRRRKETVGDLDVLVTAEKPWPVMEHFAGWSNVERVLQSGETKSSVVLRSGLQVDLRVVSPKSFGAALAYFTGSKAHNIRLRKRALERNLHLSEYGIFRTPEGQDAEQLKPSEGEWMAGRTEKEVYGVVDLPWIPPELREDRGEVEAAEQDALPRLISRRDLRGDLQMHSSWSDGRASLSEMVQACAQRGYGYMAITDHSQSLAMTGGLDADKLRRQWAEIDELAEQYEGFRILRSLETDVLRDGSLDMDDALLEQLDVVLVTVHSHLDLSQKEQTRRVLKALENPRTNILGHPTGRLIGKRPPMQLDMDEVLHCARENGVALELDAQPERLDLPDTQLIRVKELGVKLVISSDAHSVRGLDRIRYGIDQARRAGLTKGDVLNTLPVRKFLDALKRV
jgi:DNA polymerase (family 10)